MHCLVISIETANPRIPLEMTEIPSNTQSPALKCQSTVDQTRRPPKINSRPATPGASSTSCVRHRFAPRSPSPGADRR